MAETKIDIKIGVTDDTGKGTNSVKKNLGSIAKEAQGYAKNWENIRRSIESANKSWNLSLKTPLTGGKPSPITQENSLAKLIQEANTPKTDTGTQNAMRMGLYEKPKLNSQGLSRVISDLGEQRKYSIEEINAFKNRIIPETQSPKLGMGPKMLYSPSDEFDNGLEKKPTIGDWFNKNITAEQIKKTIDRITASKNIKLPETQSPRLKMGSEMLYSPSDDSDKGPGEKKPSLKDWFDKNATAEQMKKDKGASDLLSGSYKKLVGGFLSIMFFGTQVYRLFGGLVKQGLDATGIFDALGAAITFMMLPLTMKLIPEIMKLVNWIFNLNEQDRLTIGKLILLAATFGLVLMVIGQVGLAFSGLVSLLGFFGITTAAALTPLLSTLILIFLAIVAIIEVFNILAALFNWSNNLHPGDVGYRNEDFMGVNRFIGDLGHLGESVVNNNSNSITNNININGGGGSNMADNTLLGNQISNSLSVQSMRVATG